MTASNETMELVKAQRQVGVVRVGGEDQVKQAIVVEVGGFAAADAHSVEAAERRRLRFEGAVAAIHEEQGAAFEI